MRGDEGRGGEMRGEVGRGGERWGEVVGGVGRGGERGGERWGEVARDTASALERLHVGRLEAARVLPRQGRSGQALLPPTSLVWRR